MKLYEYMGYKKPEFKDAEGGIDIRHIINVAKFSNKVRLRKKAIKILEIYKKILKEEVKENE